MKVRNVSARPSRRAPHTSAGGGPLVEVPGVLPPLRRVEGQDGADRRAIPDSITRYAAYTLLARLIELGSAERRELGI